MKNNLLAFAIILLFGFSFSWGQEADTVAAQQQQQPAATGDEIIEAGEAVIQVTVEKPQVQLFSQRIKPEFDEVNLEKSFMGEILNRGGSSKLDIKATEAKAKKIETQQLLNRQR